MALHTMLDGASNFPYAWQNNDGDRNANSNTVANDWNDNYLFAFFRNSLLYYNSSFWLES